MSSTTGKLLALALLPVVLAVSPAAAAPAGCQHGSDEAAVAGQVTEIVTEAIRLRHAVAVPRPVVIGRHPVADLPTAEIRIAIDGRVGEALDRALAERDMIRRQLLRTRGLGEDAHRALLELLGGCDRNADEAHRDSWLAWATHRFVDGVKSLAPKVAVLVSTAGKLAGKLAQLV